MIYIDGVPARGGVGNSELSTVAGIKLNGTTASMNAGESPVKFSDEEGLYNIHEWFGTNYIWFADYYENQDATVLKRISYDRITTIGDVTYAVIDEYAGLPFNRADYMETDTEGNIIVFDEDMGEVFRGDVSGRAGQREMPDIEVEFQSVMSVDYDVRNFRVTGDNNILIGDTSTEDGEPANVRKHNSHTGDLIWEDGVSFSGNSTDYGFGGTPDGGAACIFSDAVSPGQGIQYVKIGKDGDREEEVFIEHSLQSIQGVSYIPDHNTLSGFGSSGFDSVAFNLHVESENIEGLIIGAFGTFAHDSTGVAGDFFYTPVEYDGEYLYQNYNLGSPDWDPGSEYRTRSLSGFYNPYEIVVGLPGDIIAAMGTGSDGVGDSSRLDLIRASTIVPEGSTHYSSFEGEATLGEACPPTGRYEINPDNWEYLQTPYHPDD